VLSAQIDPLQFVQKVQQPVQPIFAKPRLQLGENRVGLVKMRKQQALARSNAMGNERAVERMDCGMAISFFSSIAFHRAGGMSLENAT
jgi:hypothetical protein